MSSTEFKDKIFVLTGFYAAEEDFVRLIEELGGIVKNSTVLKTDYLLYNGKDGIGTKKYSRAVELNQQGKNIAILTGDEFLKMVDGDIVQKVMGGSTPRMDSDMSEQEFRTYFERIANKVGSPRSAYNETEDGFDFYLSQDLGVAKVSYSVGKITVISEQNYDQYESWIGASWNDGKTFDEKTGEWIATEEDIENSGYFMEALNYTKEFFCFEEAIEEFKYLFYEFSETYRGIKSYEEMCELVGIDEDYEPNGGMWEEVDPDEFEESFSGTVNFQFRLEGINFDETKAVIASLGKKYGSVSIEEIDDNDRMLNCSADIDEDNEIIAALLADALVSMREKNSTFTMSGTVLDDYAFSEFFIQSTADKVSVRRVSEGEERAIEYLLNEMRDAMDLAQHVYEYLAYGNNLWWPDEESDPVYCESKRFR